MGEYGDAFAAAVAAELRAERARKQMTFTMLVDKTGLSRPSILRYFNGKRDIPMAAFGDICHALGVSQRAIFEAAERTLEQD